VSSGSAAVAKMTDFATKTSGTHYDGTDPDKLSAAFASIVETITSSAKYQDVLISDKLSQYAEATDTVTYSVSAVDNNGTAADKKGAIASYDDSTKTIKLGFPEGTVIDPDVTYTVSLNIRPTAEAYRYYAAQGSYPSIGDADTDKDTATSSGLKGFYSNATDAANVYYKVVTTVGDTTTVSDQKQSAYPKPVIQVEIPTLTLVKSVNNTNAGKYGAAPEGWTLSALTDAGAGVDAVVPSRPFGPPATQGVVSKSTKDTAIVPGKYTLSEDVNDSYRKDGKAYAYYGGYTAGSWTCVDNANEPVTVGANNLLTVNRDQHIVCTVVNTAKPGSIAWQKIDDSSAGARLGGSEWSLASSDVSGFTKKSVVDDGTNDDAANQQGSLKVSGLAWGKYDLQETKAPLGYQLKSTVYSVSVLPDNQISTDASFTVQAGENGKIKNSVVPVTALPLTGGHSARDWLIYGGGLGLLVVAAGASYLIRRKRRLM
jgi:hypothetical protein